MTVFDYNNNAVEVKFPANKTDDDIAAIFVQVLSGDETGHVIFKDGSVCKFDAGHGSRIVGYDDGRYYVTGDAVADWLSFIGWHTPGTASYIRQELFSKKERDDE